MKISFIVIQFQSNFITYAKESKLYLALSQNKKIALAVAAIFSLLAISYFVYSKRFKASKQDQNKRLVSDVIPVKGNEETKTKSNPEIKKETLSPIMLKENEILEEAFTAEHPPQENLEKDLSLKEDEDPAPDPSCNQSAISKADTTENETVETKTKSDPEIKKETLSPIMPQENEILEEALTVEHPPQKNLEKDLSLKKDEDTAPDPTLNLSTISETDITENEITESELEFPTAPFGKFIEGKDHGPLPCLDSVGEKIEPSMMNYLFQSLTTVFVSCFHSTESYEETLDRLTDLRILSEMRDGVFIPNKGYIETFSRLKKHLILIHDSLPGKRLKKEVKIYWNENAEKILSPYLFNTNDLKVENLIFEIIPGEHADSNFQAAQMNFNKQLQFVDLSVSSKFSEQLIEFDRLVLTVCGVTSNSLNQIVEIWAAKRPSKETDDPIVDRAEDYTNRMTLMKNLQTLEAKDIAIELFELPFEEQKKFIQELMPFVDLK